ncbi:hypothetical protein VDGL01_03269 [Verticillium dahliae]
MYNSSTSTYETRLTRLVLKSAAKRGKAIEAAQGYRCRASHVCVLKVALALRHWRHFHDPSVTRPPLPVPAVALPPLSLCLLPSVSGLSPFSLNTNHHTKHTKVLFSAVDEETLVDSSIDSGVEEKEKRLAENLSRDGHSILPLHHRRRNFEDLILSHSLPQPPTASLLPRPLLLTDQPKAATTLLSSIAMHGTLRL